ncbi:MAG: hypothetical protein ACRCWR_11765 [Saezia sp.]
MKFKILLLALISAAFLSACDKKETPAPAPDTNAQQTTQPAAPAAEPTAPAAEPAAAPAAAAGSTGVAECDEYLTKVMTCYETKVPEAVRGAMVDGLNQMKAAWMATPADQKGALADSCKQALEGSKASLQAYGCTL